MKEPDFENLPSFQIPESILSEIYDLTGESENSRGFILFCVGQNGSPFIYKKSSNQVIELGLIKAMEEYSTGLLESPELD